MFRFVVGYVVVGAFVRGLVVVLLFVCVFVLFFWWCDVFVGWFILWFSGFLGLFGWFFFFAWLFWCRFLVCVRFVLAVVLLAMLFVSFVFVMSVFFSVCLWCVPGFSCIWGCFVGLICWPSLPVSFPVFVFWVWCCVLCFGSRVLVLFAGCPSFFVRATCSVVVLLLFVFGCFFLSRASLGLVERFGRYVRFGITCAPLLGG